MDNNLVSVVIPAYNCARMIEQSVGSVLRQDYPNIEVIVVDDGSTDQTGEAVQRLTQQSDKIKYFSQDNQGPGAARNRGILEASGDYIAFLDADDQLLKGSIAERARFLDAAKGTGLVFSDYYDLNENCETEGQTPRLAEFIFGSHFEMIDEKLPNCYIADTDFPQKYLSYHPYPVWTGTVMIRKSVVPAAGLFRTDIKSGEDHDYWLRVIGRTQAGYIKKPLAVYRRSSASLSNSDERHLRESVILLQDLLYHRAIPAELVKKELADGYYALACEYSKQKSLTPARQCFWKALRYNPLKFKNWIGLIFPAEASLRFFRKLNENVRF